MNYREYILQSVPARCFTLSLMRVKREALLKIRIK